MQEIGRIAKMLSSYVESENSDKTLQEYIDVILYEKNKIAVNDAAKSDLEEIREYVDRLKKLKSRGIN